MRLKPASFFKTMNQGTVLTGAIMMGIAAQVAMSPVAHAQVTPSQVMVALAPGQSVDVNKSVQTPEIPPNPDILFLADTTGSMGATLANVKANATAVMNTVIASQPTAQFAVAEYRDFGDSFVVQTNQDITASIAAAQAAINTWDANEGGDTPEGQLFALNSLAGSISWRPGSTRIIAWFGDASGHDPSGGVTLATAIASLLGENIRVIAIPVDSGSGDGLDATGQATAIANATGGSVLPEATPDEVADSILEGLQALPVTVIPTAGACGPLTVSFSPPSATVTSGEVALFVETITAPDDPSFCDDVNCFVEFKDENGNLIGIQEILVEALDIRPPVVTGCSALEMWPPNHKYQEFTLSDLGITVQDVCDGTLDVDAVGQIVSISSDEPEDALGLGDGATLDDMVILSRTTFKLRSERDGGTGNVKLGKGPSVANGRVYTINFVVTDAAGNQTAGSCQVGVPHDQSGPAAVDDGPLAGYTIP
jgi:hypothetical protein